MGQAKRKQEPVSAPFQLDGWLFGSAVALACVGLIMVTSASMAVAEQYGLGQFHFAIRHLVALCIGCALGVFVCNISLAYLERTSALLMLLIFPLLMLVFVPGLGVTVNGSTRWVRAGIMNFQVVEAAKLMLAVYLASYLVRHGTKLRESFFGVLKPCIVAVLITFLLLAQPDYGGSVLVLTLTGAMIWIGGARFRDLFAMFVAVLPFMVWAAVSENYRLRRLRSFLDPWADPFNDGFQLTQALIAIGRGEWFGVGLGGSVQKLFYLPEAHNDFIFAVISEELGFVGVVGVIGLFALIVGRGLHIAMAALQRGQLFNGYLAYGLSTLLGIQAAVSIGVNFGLLPTKGLTLPLISSGGSSVMMTCVTIAVLLRVASEVRAADAVPGTAAGARA